jgi:hypothetical protein
MTRQLSTLQRYDLEWLLNHIGTFHTIRMPKDSIEYAFRKTIERLKTNGFDCSEIESKYYKARAEYLTKHLKDK